MDKPADSRALSTWARQWRMVRRVWATLGGVALVLFLAYGWWFTRATGFDRKILTSDERIAVEATSEYLSFVPISKDLPAESSTARKQADAATGGRAATGLTGVLFFPGAMVEPEAYAPLAHSVADAGRPVLIVKLTSRWFVRDADERDTIARAHRLIQDMPAVKQWLVAGHSRGGAVAAGFVHAYPADVQGLFLIGTSHPKELELSDWTGDVTKVYASRDGLATVAEVRRFAHNLPAHTTWVEIAGGNHCQFGRYGFQIGDRYATISRDEQERQLLEVLEAALARLEGQSGN